MRRWIELRGVRGGAVTGVSLTCDKFVELHASFSSCLVARRGVGGAAFWGGLLRPGKSPPMRAQPLPINGILSAQRS